MTALIVYYLVFVAFSHIALKKYELDTALQESRFKLLYKIGVCGFCLRFWLAVASVAAVNTILGFGWQDLIMPFAVVGAWLIGNDLKNV